MDSDLLQNVFPLIVTLLLALLIPTIFMIVSRFMGPQTKDPVKLSAYECGIQPKQLVGDARHRFHVKFYLVAMFFLIFDVEVLFLFPWAVWFQNDILYGFVSMLAFLGILIFGWYYLLKRGAFEWE
mgnify:CR=1 FL=1